MNAVLIGSPLQLLNALEARHRIEGLNSPSILLVYPTLGDGAGLDKLIAETAWPNVIRLRQGGFLPAWHHRRHLERIVSEFGPFSAVCLGDYRFDLMRHFAAVAAPRRLVILDDGLGSLVPAGGHSAMPGGRSLAARARTLVKTVCLRQRVDDPGATRILFSAYDTSPASAAVTIKNDYRFLRSLIGATTNSEQVYMIGSPLSDLGMMPMAVYLAYLRAARRHFEDRGIVYLAHRRETDASLATIRDQTGLHTERSSSCIEWQLIRGRQLPAVLAGFSSAALMNCRHIFGDALKIVSLYVQPEHLAPRWRSGSDAIYAAFRSQLEVVSLDVESR